LETKAEKIARLRTAVETARRDLIEAEASLADERADIQAFEFEFEARVGQWLTQLSQVEAEVTDLLDAIQQRRNQQAYGAQFPSVEEQYRRTWQTPPQSPPKVQREAVSADTEAQIKKLYRQLARRLHPDLAADNADRDYRTEMMTAVNDAYAARSLAELLAMARQLDGDERPSAPLFPGQTEDELIKALAEELRRCQQRQQRIALERQNLHNGPMISLSLDARLAQRQGRDLLAEMAQEAQRRLARKTVERDMIKAQFASLNRPDV
jgi:hypothetical protein